MLVKRYLASFILLLMLITSLELGNFITPIPSYAETYGTFDTKLAGGEVKKATAKGEFLYEVEYPSDTKEVQFYIEQSLYDVDIDHILGKDDKQFSKEDLNHTDGWWTADISSGDFDLSQGDLSSLYEDNELDVPEDLEDYDYHVINAVDTDEQSMWLVIKTEKQSEQPVTEYSRYDTKLIDDAKVNKPVALVDQYTYLVKYPYGTEQIKVYMDKDENGKNIDKIYYYDNNEKKA